MMRGLKRYNAPLFKFSIITYITAATTAFVLHPRSLTSNQLSFKCGDNRLLFNKNYSSATGQDETTSSVDVTIAVHRVSICMGELCKCQEEGNNAESIMADLQSRNLPFIVEDAPCLGACGLGSMVSIEYEDGDYALVTGLEETLSAIRITDSARIEANNIAVSVDLESLICNDDDQTFVDNTAMTNLSDDMKNASCGALKQVLVYDEVKAQTLEKDKTVRINDIPKENKVEVEHDAIKRMRAEAIQNEENKPNPWMNMALYIGKKVKESLVKENS